MANLTTNPSGNGIGPGKTDERLTPDLHEARGWAVNAGACYAAFVAVALSERGAPQNDFSAASDLLAEPLRRLGVVLRMPDYSEYSAACALSLDSVIADELAKIDTDLAPVFVFVWLVYLLLWGEGDGPCATASETAAVENALVALARGAGLLDSYSRKLIGMLAHRPTDLNKAHERQRFMSWAHCLASTSGRCVAIQMRRKDDSGTDE